MTTPKTRAARILDRRRSALDEARLELEARARASRAASEQVLDAARALDAAREHLQSSPLLRAADLVDAHNHAAASELRLVAAQQRAASCEALERQARAEVTRARTEVRKVELWHESLAAAELAAEARMERKAADEIASMRRPEDER
jgi:hypothetical protein